MHRNPVTGQFAPYNNNADSHTIIWITNAANMLTQPTYCLLNQRLLAYRIPYPFLECNIVVDFHTPAS